MVSHSAIVLILIPIVALILLGLDTSAFGQQSTERYIIARIEIWALFYRLMVVAFIIGAVVMGTMTYIVWRFRESHPKNRGDIKPASGGVRH